MSTNGSTLIASPSKFDNHVGAGATIKGKFDFTGTALVEGIVYGDIEGFGRQVDTVIINATGKIFGSVRCAVTEIAGTVVGNIYAKQVSLLANSTVQGDIFYETLGIHAQAVVNGKLIQQSIAMKTEIKPPLLLGTNNSSDQITDVMYKNKVDMYPALESIKELDASSSPGSIPPLPSSYNPKRIWQKNKLFKRRLSY